MAKKLSLSTKEIRVNLVQRDSGDTLDLLEYLDLLAILVNMERRAFLDILGQEDLQALTDLLGLQDHRD